MNYGHPGLFLLLIFLYFIPYLEAICRKKKNRSSILVLNFFLGWTVIGWIAALIWASTKD